MPNSFIISELAQQELEESVDWYDDRLWGLGLEFADSIYAAADHLTKHPDAYSAKRGKLREFVVKRFPFVIVYEFIETERLINILHVFHTSRHPKFKYRKK